MASISWRQGLRALVTRPREDAAALGAALAARGVGALIEPMMQIRFRAAAIDLGGVQAVLCTSANGVRALAQVTGERGVPLFAVGDATAVRARAEGFACVASARGDAGDLVLLATERLRPQDGPLVHVSGSAVAGDLVAELGARGFAVERSVLYEARPVPALSVAAKSALSAGEINFALFYSPRTAAIFRRLAEAAGVARSCGTVIALSISAAADKALDALPWRERRIAERPDQLALLDLLDGVLAERRHG
jgi:uroporphyrinogen-III synthase